MELTQVLEKQLKKLKRAQNRMEEKLWQQVPSRPDLLFVCASYDDIYNVIKEKKLAKLQFVYDNSAANTFTPLTIPQEPMNNLIRIVECSIPQSYSVTDEEIHYRPGGIFDYSSHVMNPKEPYVELCAGIHNIFKLLHVEYVRRLNYNDLPTANKWGIRLMIRTVF